jgi:hypothetical protein
MGVCQTLFKSEYPLKHDKSNKVLKPFDMDLFCPRRLDLANPGRVDLWLENFWFNHKPTKKSWLGLKTTQKQNQIKKIDYTPKKYKNSKILKQNGSNTKKTHQTWT